MAEFAESPFRFTDPIRYFKANDPIYYEVDNIPLKQLQENNLWLKDQLAKLEYNQIFNTSNITNTTNNFLQVGRSGFSELQAYVNGSNNIVYVRPGRFTARINDAYNLQPLQIISKLTNNDFIDSYNVKTNRDGTLRSVLNKFKTQLESNAIGMNGLIERSFTRASRNIEQLSQFLNSTDPRYLPIPVANVPDIPYPATVGQNFIYNLVVSSINSTSYTQDGGFLNSVWQESNFIKKWRGIARTSIVDVPSQLEIEIPAFNQADFYYTDENGVSQPLTSANQRIDLLFIYSKPIDVSAVSLAKFSNGSNTPTKIYSPQLGIVKGAGIGLNLDTRTYDTDKVRTSITLQDANGNPMIVPSISDELGQNLGFSSIKGSFPSPDDLMNIAPTLLENLESNDISLLGQSILPIAYIVVKKTAQLNSANVSVLNTEDVIDIRPFFRTTELAYNERAGIAAAFPQISLANPVATENYVDLIAKGLSDRINGINPGGGGGGGGPSVTGSFTSYGPRIVHSGKIYGGWKSWGPEHTLLNWIKKQNPSLTTNDAFDLLRAKFFYEVPIQDQYPTWDYSEWAKQTLTVAELGTKLGDYINFMQEIPLSTGVENSQKFPVVGAYADNPANGGNKNRIGRDRTLVHWVSKIFKINKEEASWAEDFDVRVEYLNCAPISNSVGGGIFITKEKSSTGEILLGIHVSWEPRILFSNNIVISPKQNRDLYNNYVHFAVLVPDIIRNIVIGTSASQDGHSKYGTCVLPSISFDIIGYPADWKQNKFYNNRYGNTVITLK